MRFTQEDVEKWRNRQLSMMVNSLPVWNGALNIGSDSLSHLTSAETAKIRLHGVVAQDRKACGDGKWKLVRKGSPYRYYRKLGDKPESMTELFDWYKQKVNNDIARDKYRWAYRR